MEEFPRRLRWFVVVLAFLLALLAALDRPPRGLERYPPPEASAYLLPWPEGRSWLCVQGNDGAFSHHGAGEHAYDFYMPVGSPVCAARAGVVVAVKDDSRRVGRGADNNYVRVRHEDGSEGHYLHLDTGGARVRVGERVAQRQVIARSGWTGYAALPHLHFHVTQGGRHQPISFRDLGEDRGVPRPWRFYRAGR